MAKDSDLNREAATRVVESYLQCVVGGRFAELPITSDYGSESPRSGLLEGQAAIDYLTTIGPRDGRHSDYSTCRRGRLRRHALRGSDR